MAPFSRKLQEKKQQHEYRKDSTASTATTVSSRYSTFTFDDDRWSDDSFDEMVLLWNLNETDKTNMRQLQQKLSDINHWKNDPFEVVRYYKEYRTVHKAGHMFRRMVEWRLREKIDSFLDDYGDPPQLFHYLPTFLCQGLDRDGDPIYVERTGAGDPYGLVLEYGIEALADYTEFIREMTTNRHATHDDYCWQRDYYEPLMKRRMKQFTVIMDMDGLNYRHLKGGLLGLLQRMARISQDYYAGFAKRVIIIRAPSMFQWGWNNIVSHFFDQHIRDIITICSVDDYLEEMNQHIDITVLPECLAPGYGTGQAMPGYFEKIHLYGGFIPKDCDYVPHISVPPPTTKREQESDQDDTASRSDDDDEGSVPVKITAGSLLKGMWEESAMHQQSITHITVFAG